MCIQALDIPEKKNMHVSVVSTTSIRTYEGAHMQLHVGLLDINILTHFYL